MEEAVEIAVGHAVDTSGMRPDRARELVGNFRESPIGVKLPDEADRTSIAPEDEGGFNGRGFVGLRMCVMTLCRRFGTGKPCIVPDDRFI